MTPQTVDYAQTGLTIQAAIVDHARRYPDKQARPPSILWAGRQVMTADALSVPHHGQVQADERLRVWNVYKVKLPGGQVREDKWTGNAGFWVEEISDRERIYHCSPGPLETPTSSRSCSAS